MLVCNTNFIILSVCFFGETSVGDFDLLPSGFLRVDFLSDFVRIISIYRHKFGLVAILEYNDFDYQQYI